ncbi:MAG TPA: hypothetical protein VFM48_03280, partial [Aquabacterium sp.]|nr:hypothetical protein [Aquabacterium sp.]
IVAGDFPNTSLTQRFYTLWDRGNFSTSSAGSGGASTSTRALPTHASLVQRQLVRDPATGDVTLSDADTAASINWTVQDGWYLDFPVAPGQTIGTGEMVLSTPVVRSGVLFFTTVWPNADAASMCQSAPLSTLYALSPTQGLAVHGLLPTAAAVGVSVSDSKVLVVSDQLVTPEAGKEALRIEGRNWEMPVAPPSRSGRVQWRVIPGLKTH